MQAIYQRNHTRKLMRPNHNRLTTKSFCHSAMTKPGKNLRKLKKQHLSRPLAHIFRFAVVGSLTRRGGVIRHASGGATTGGLQVALGR